jgi:hypothetical protein
MNARRLTLSVLATTLGALAFTAAPALAALETPEKEAVSAVTATTAHVSGVLNPKATGGVEGGFYGFFYGLSEPAACGEEKLVPEPFGSAGIAAGMPGEVKEETLTGLQPHAKYTFCLLELNDMGTEQLEGTPVPFETEPAPPEVVPGGESATPVKATEATLRAVVNPNNEPTKYRFEYSKSATGETLNAPVTTVEGAPPAAELEEGYGGQGVAALTGAVLEPNKTYYYRVIAENAQSETEPHPAEGAVKSFATTTPSKEEATAITGTTVTLNGVLNSTKAGEADAYEFLYKASPTVCEGENETSYTTVSGGPAKAVKAEVTGLLPHTTYTFCLQEYNELNEATVGAPVTFTTSAVGIAGEASAEVGTTSTKLVAQIDPGGAESTYFVEYGASEAYGSSTPEVSAGAGSGYVGVQVALAGLQSDALYHFRFVAKSSFGTTRGPDVTFTTVPPAASALPDSRVIELVSHFPAGTDEEAYVPGSGKGVTDVGFTEHGISTENKPFQVASDGEAVTYVGDPPPAGGNGSTGESSGNEYMTTHSLTGGWAQVDLQPPGVYAAAYKDFSSDLSVGILGETTQSELGLGPEEYRDVYLHATAGGAGGEYEPLYTGAFPDTGRNFVGSYYAGANAGTGAVPAFSHLLLEANTTLLTGEGMLEKELVEDVKKELVEEDHGDAYLYDRAGGRLSLVDVLPDGKVQPNASFGSPRMSGGNGSSVPPDMSDAISADGSRIFWTALEGTSEQGYEHAPRVLYARENDTRPQSSLEGGRCTEPAQACTVQIDASETAEPGGGGDFQVASTEGNRVFFLDCNRLTAGSTAVSSDGCSHVEHDDRDFTGNDLYEYDFAKPEGERLVDLTVDHNGDSLGADVLGVLGSSIGPSEGESFIYFAADGVLAGENAEGKQPTAEQPNLYLLHNGETTFIATLSSEDGFSVHPVAQCGASPACQGDWQSAPSYRTAEVTPDGQSLVFMSNQGLTGYQNEGLDEVFAYEASSGKLRCASCNPSGEPPVPTEFNTYSEPLGGFIPTSESNIEQPRVISEDGGRVFFDSGEPLVPTDTNGWLDVYEWEREGEGTCTSQTASSVTGGCAYLLSGGTDPESSYLIGADTSGENLFFISRAQLVPADRGGDDDEVYDARIDGAQPPVTSACEGTGCQGVPPTPPIFATPSSATFNGIGNFPPAAPAKKTTRKTVRCKKNFTKKKSRCVKTKKKKTKVKKNAKKAGTKRRAQS